MSSLLQLLRSIVIPWTIWDARSRLVVARPKISAASLPFGVTVSPHAITGKRVLVRGLRHHANQRLLVAEWPQANLHEITLPKLSCIVDGEADYLLGKHSVHCPAGHFILIPPRAPHHRAGPFLQEPHLKNGSCTLLQAYAYSRDVLLWICRSHGNRHTNDKQDNFLIPNAEAAHIFRLLIEEAKIGNAGFEVICHSLMTAFFSLLVRDIEEGRYTHPGPQVHSHSLAPRADDFAGQLQEYLQANFDRHIIIDDAALYMYMSRSQFCRRVRHDTGTTFTELLTSCRMENAQKMLQETDWTVLGISRFVGFDSCTHFQGLFRQRVGCTASEYRQKHQGKTGKDKLPKK